MWHYLSHYHKQLNNKTGSKNADFIYLLFKLEKPNPKTVLFFERTILTTIALIKLIKYAIIYNIKELIWKILW